MSGLLPLLAIGCGGTDPSPPRQPLEDVAWRLELNHHAVLLSMTAPWDTLPLMATPVNYRGDTLPGLPAPQFSSNDIEHVRVTPDGVLHAVAPTAGNTTAQVIVELTANNVRNVDTVYVRVMETTDPPPVLHSFSIHPLPPDSAKRAVEKQAELTFIFAQPAQLSARATDPDGNAIPNVPVYYRSSDNTIARVSNGGPNGMNDTFTGRQPGAVTFYASTTVFGVTKADTLPYRIGWRLLSTINLQRIVPTDGSAVRFELVPSEITVGTGAYVAFSIPGDMPDTALTDVVFAEAARPNVAAPTILPTFPSFLCEVGAVDCNSGNVLFGPSPYPPSAARVFTQPGTYEYHSLGLGVSGRIVVVDEH